ncbi:MAG: hypothetical protein NXI24_12910 [bacterium]|nr:hypothetical protein [bacterium]
MRKIILRLTRALLGFSLGVVGVLLVYFLYLQSLIGVDPATVAFNDALKDGLAKAGHRPAYFVLSSVRPRWWNAILVSWSGAASNSQHLDGRALDIIVLDVNQDGASDARDVWIVYALLDKAIIGRRGGVGTYVNEAGFFNRQMIHFDSRGFNARWHR